MKHLVSRKVFVVVSLLLLFFLKNYYTMTLAILLVIIIKSIKNLTSYDAILFITQICLLQDIEHPCDKKTF